MKKIILSLLLLIVCGIGLLSVNNTVSALSPYTYVNISENYYNEPNYTPSPYTFIYFDLTSFNDDTEPITIFNTKYYNDNNYSFGLKYEGVNIDNIGESVLYFNYYDEDYGVREEIIVDGSFSKLPRDYLYLMVIETNYTYQYTTPIWLYVIDYDMTDTNINNLVDNLYIVAHYKFYISEQMGELYNYEDQFYLIDRRVSNQIYAYGSFTPTPQWALGQVKRNYKEGYISSMLNNGFNYGSMHEEFKPNWLFTIIDFVDSILSINLLPNVTIGTLLLIPLCLGLIALILVFWRKD